MHLAVHLENGQRIYYNKDNVREQIINPKDTTLTAFFKLCQVDQFAQTLLYYEIPSYYTWQATKREFQARKNGNPVPGIFNDLSLDFLGIE